MAQAPRTQPATESRTAPAAGQNAQLTVSAGGQAALASREGQRPGGGYYDDSARNCTYGTGLLAHMGPCTAEELRRTVDPQHAQAEFTRRTNEAAGRVREMVPNRSLTQNQFDALVSATYNTRTVDNRVFLGSANSGDDAAVARELRGLVHTHDHNAQGRPVGPARASQGLINRRNSELDQYGRAQ